MVTIGFTLNNIVLVDKAYDAPNILESKEFNLMSSNLWMSSSLNGLELLEKIRSHGDNKIKEIPFMLITGEKN